MSEYEERQILNYKLDHGIGGFIFLKPSLVAWLKENEIEYEEIYTTSSSFLIYILNDDDRLFANLRWIK